MIYKIRKRDKIPKGTIIMWNGDITDVPRGWVVCNGNNGTPDTRNRFIMGNETSGVIINKNLEAKTTIDGIHVHPMNKNQGGYGDSIHGVLNDKKEKIVYLGIEKSKGHQHSINYVKKLNPDCITSIFLMKL